MMPPILAFLNLATILHFRSDMILVKIEHVNSSYVFSGAIKWPDHYCSIFRNGTNMRVSLKFGIILSHNKRSRQ